MFQNLLPRDTLEDKPIGGFKSKLDNPVEKNNLIIWDLVQLMMLGMQIFVIAKLLVAGVKENIHSIVHTSHVLVLVP